MTIRIGITGCSGHYEYVIGGMECLPEACICAVAPGCPEEDMSGLMKHPTISRYSPNYYSDYRHMLDREDLDIVVVNPFYYLHSQITVEALIRGICVFCEKPLAIDMESLGKVRDAQMQLNTRMGMMLNFRYDPRFYTAHELVKEGAIGVPTLGYSQKSYKLGTRPWFYEKRETFGGLIPWVGIHAIDWFRWVSGVDYSSVVAYHTNMHAPQYPGMEDIAGCLFELSNGGVATMSFDYLRPSGASTHGDDRLRLVGSQGIIEIDDNKGLVLTDESGSHQVELRNPPHDIFADFALTVADPGHECLISTEDALSATRTSLLARESADLGRQIQGLY